MVKKFLFLFTFLFITLSFNLNVNAMPLGYPTVFPHYLDTVGNSQTAILSDWWNTEYYVSPFRLGLTTTTSGYNRIDFNWFNANLCPDNNLHISGSIGGLYSLFYKSPVIAIYNNGQRMNCTFSEPLDSGSRITFNCSGVGGGNLSIYIQESNPDFSDTYAVGVTRDIDVRCEASNNDIINNQNANTNSIINNQNQNTNTITNNQNQNTQNIINNQNSNTNTITNNQNQNTQNIINNQNQNTQQEIESQKVCRTIDNSYIVNRNFRINGQNGQLVSSNNIGVTDFLNVNSGTTIKVVSGGTWGAHGAFYDSSKNFISSFYNPDLVADSYLTIPTNASYVRFSIQIPQNIPNFSICNNGNQALTDSLTDTSAPDSNSAITDMENMTASDTPISDLITMPLTLLTSYINGMNATCSPYNLGNLYGTDLILPCINIENRIGSNLWSIIDILFSLFMCYNIGMLFVSAFDSITSLKDNFDSLYTPRHADTGYQPKHGG